MADKNLENRGTPVAYFQALNRSFHILGVDRGLFFLFVGICLPIPFSAHFALKMDLLAALLFVVLHVIGVVITRTDAQFLVLYRRHIHFKKYYAPQPGLAVNSALILPSVPFYQGKNGLV